MLIIKQEINASLQLLITYPRSYQPVPAEEQFEFVPLVTELRNVFLESEVVQPLGQVDQQLARDDLSDGHLLHGVGLPVIAHRPVELVGVLVLLDLLDQAGSAELVAVEADDDAASGASPMVVEQRGLAHVAVFSHPPHLGLPNDPAVLADVQGQALPLLLHHVAELVADQTQHV